MLHQVQYAIDQNLLRIRRKNLMNLSSVLKLIFGFSHLQTINSRANHQFTDKLIQEYCYRSAVESGGTILSRFTAYVSIFLTEPNATQCFYYCLQPGRVGEI